MEEGMEMVENQYGIRVKRRCASCQHKCINREGMRLCAKAMVVVPPWFVCRWWQMSDGLKKAGRYLIDNR